MESLAYRNLNDLVYGRAIQPANVSRSQLGLGRMLLELVLDKGNAWLEVLAGEFLFGESEVMFIMHIYAGSEWCAQNASDQAKRNKKLLDNWSLKTGIRASLHVRLHGFHIAHAEQFREKLAAFAHQSASFINFFSLAPVSLLPPIDFNTIFKEYFEKFEEACGRMALFWQQIVNDFFDVERLCLHIGSLATSIKNRIYNVFNRLACVFPALTAYEAGLKGFFSGQGEGVMVKAITGRPFVLSPGWTPFGSSAIAVADALSAHASAIGPMASCQRMLNKQQQRGANAAIEMRDLLSAGDSFFSPQAFIARADIAASLARTVIQQGTSLQAAFACFLQAADLIQDACKYGELQLPKQEEADLQTLKKNLILF